MQHAVSVCPWSPENLKTIWQKMFEVTIIFIEILRHFLPFFSLIFLLMYKGIFWSPYDVRLSL